MVTVPEFSGYAHELKSARGVLPHQMIPCASLLEGSALPQEIQKVKNVIYLFFDRQEDKYYVGKTSGPLARRLGKHKADVRVAKDRFHQALQDRPSDFYFGLLAGAQSSRGLSTMERAKIAEYDSCANGYNGNKGGGGGISKEGFFTPTKALRTEGFSGLSPLKKITPDRYFPLRIHPKNKKIQFNITPNSGKATDLVYVLKNEATGERYVGGTGNSLKKRASQHLCLARSATLKKTNRVYEDMQKWPHKFRIGILHECQDPRSGPGMEMAFIEAKQSILQGYNKTRGGNGSFRERLDEVAD